MLALRRRPPLALLAAALLAACGGAADPGARTAFTQVEIDTEILIAAPPEAVWAVLSDLPRYPEWNPYHVRVEGALEPGAELDVSIEKPNGVAVALRPHVLEVSPGRALVWGGGPRGIFRGEHRFDLAAEGPDCTRLRHSEVFAGLFVGFAKLDGIEPGYRAMNEALKARVEGGAPGGCGA